MEGLYLYLSLSLSLFLSYTHTYPELSKYLCLMATSTSLSPCPTAKDLCLVYECVCLLSRFGVLNVVADSTFMIVLLADMHGERVREAL